MFFYCFSSFRNIFMKNLSYSCKIFVNKIHLTVKKLITAVIGKKVMKFIIVFIKECIIYFIKLQQFGKFIFQRQKIFFKEAFGFYFC